MRPALLTLAVSLMCVWSSSDARDLPLARRAPLHLSWDDNSLIIPRKSDAAHLSKNIDDIVQPKQGGSTPTAAMTTAAATIAALTTAAATTAAPGADNRTCSTPCGIPNTSTRIVGGQETELHEYPWQVGLVSGGQVFCGGSIISPTAILTAAHCVPAPGQHQVVIGEHIIGTSTETSATNFLDIEEVITHENYNTGTLENDIALVILAEPINFPDNNTIAPVCLPRNGGSYDNVNATVTGWGTTSSGGTQPDTLQEVIVETMSNQECEAQYGAGNIFSNMLCASAPGKDSCQGDSGGPLVAATGPGNTMEQIGIVSWGYGCARPNYPGVYTRVTSYIQWIEDQIGPLCSPQA